MPLLGKKRKRSRWGAKDDKAVVTGLVTLPADLTDEQRKHYLCEYSKPFFTARLYFLVSINLSVSAWCFYYTQSF